MPNNFVRHVQTAPMLQNPKSFKGTLREKIGFILSKVSCNMINMMKNDIIILVFIYRYHGNTMAEVEVIVKACVDSNSFAKFTIKDGRYITVYIPSSDHKNSNLTEEKFGEWRIELRHRGPGYRKPYLLNLANQEKVRFNCCSKTIAEKSGIPVFPSFIYHYTG